MKPIRKAQKEKGKIKNKIIYTIQIVYTKNLVCTYIINCKYETNNGLPVCHINV